MEHEYVVLLTTFATKHDADEAAAELVDHRLAACVQVGGPIGSTYRWAGKIESSTEYTCHVKTRRDKFEAVAAALRKRHPYDTPEILAVPVVAGDADYLKWIDASLDGE